MQRFHFQITDIILGGQLKFYQTYNGKFKLNAIKFIRNMQITKMRVMPDQSLQQIPVQKTHPIMDQRVLENYEKVLSYSNLKLHEQISHRNIKILENQFVHQIYTKSDPKLPHLVFLHGFGGTSMTAIRMFQHLHSHFQVDAIDAFGFGYSSRGNFSEDFSFEETKEYYVKAVEEWRKALKIQKFYLVGHSFGGYLAAWYTATYPERVIHLFLVSPAGASQTRNFRGDGQMTCRRKLFLSLAQKVYNWNIRPSKAMNNFFIGNKMVNSILINRLKIPEDQQDDWKQYLRNVNSQDQSSQTGFYKLFQWPLKPKITIQDMIRKQMITCSVDFYFGDEDWMPKDGAQRILKQKIKNVNMTIVPKAGHQIVFDNSPFLCRCILERASHL